MLRRKSTRAHRPSEWEPPTPTVQQPQHQPQQSKKHSKLSKQSIVQGLNQLHAPKDYDTDPKCVDIIAVPGLGSDMTHTWMCRGVHWLRDESMLPRAIPKARILVYGYRSQWFGPDAVDIRLSTIGRDLLGAIKVDRQDAKNKKRPIIFIGHSLGGLVVSKAVTVAKRESEKFKGVIDCITACVFLGTPFRGSEAQPWAKLIGLAGSVLGQAKYSSLLGTMKSGSTELDDLRDEFLADVGSTRIDVECYFELEKTNNMVIADEKSSTLDGKPRHPWARTHSQMNKFEGPKDWSYRQLSGSLKDMANQSFKIIRLRQDALRQEIVNDVRVDKVIESLEVFNPRRAFETIRRISGLVKGVKPSSWIQQNELYTGWRDEASSETMWICGSAGKGKTMAAMAIVEEISQRVQYASDLSSLVLCHFFCDEQDKDKNKALSVLRSLAGQLLKARKDLTRYFFGDDGASKTGGHKGNTEYEFNSLPDLWKCLKMALSDPSLGTVFFVVNSLDQIDLESRKQLLSAITSFRPILPEDEEDTSGPFVKWLFLSAPRDDIAESLHEVRVLNLDDGSNSAKQDDDLRIYVSQKISQIAEKRNFSRALEYFVKSFICLRARGQSNYDWVNLVCLELENDELDKGAVRSRLEGLPTDLYPMYDQVSRRVLQGSNVQAENAKEILRCLLLVRSAPTLQELAVIAGLPETDWQNQKELRKHVERCGALTTVFREGPDFKVQLSHTSVREFLKSKASDWLSMGSEQIQHGVISLRCFDYVLAAVEKGADAEAEDTIADKTEDQAADAEASDDGREQKVDEDNDDSEDDDDDDDEVDEYEYEYQYGSEAEAEQNTDQPAKNEKLLRYPVTEWIEHALQATADIVDNLGVADVFWLLGSKERAEWSRNYTNFTSATETQLTSRPDFDANSTALHVAAYFGYVPLADLLLKSDQHDGELQTADQQGLQPLYWACRKGHLDMVQRLFAAGADINYQSSEEHQTALHGAAMSENPEITSFLLNHGAHVNFSSEGSGTPLYIACEAGSLPIVQQLFEKGADPNIVGGLDHNALNAAVSSGELEVVKLLLEKGAELNPTENSEYGNALSMACYYGERDVAEYLLHQGCHWDKEDSDGSPPLEIAANQGYDSIVSLLLEYDQRPESHEKALLSATKECEPDVVRILVTQCPEIPHGEAFYHAASNGYTSIVETLTAAGVESHILEKSLYEAVDYQYEETVRVLLDMGLDANAEGKEYGNALQASAYDGTTNILQMLLDKGAHPSRVYPGSDYGTALQAACYEGTLDNVKILLDRGADVNPYASGEYGTPLAAACAQGRTEIAQMLLEHGADANLEGGKFGYAIVAAAEGSDQETLELLLSYGADVNVQSPIGSTPLTNAALFLPTQCVKLIVEHGAALHAQDEDRDTALTNAASTGDENSVRYLLEQGLDVQHVSDWGGALHRAIYEAKSLECVRVLLEYHVDVNQEGGLCHTPLQAAAHNGDMEFVELLLNNGANVDLTGGKYHTALQAAVAADNLNIVQLLLEHGADPVEAGGEYGSALHAAIYATEPIPLIDLLLEHGADVNTVHERGTPLQLAAVVAEADVVSHLLENGANPNLVIGKYGTPLQAACLMEDDEVISVLLEHGADPFLRGGYFGSPFVAAAAFGMEDYVKQGIARDPPADMLVQALHYAVHFRERNIVEVLLQHGVDVNVRSNLFGSAILALEAEMTDSEKKIKEGDDDLFWNLDEEDDYGEDDEGDEEADEADSDNEDDDNENDNDDGDDDDDTKAEVEKEIRALLEPLIQKPSIPVRKPVPRRPVPWQATQPNSTSVQHGYSDGTVRYDYSNELFLPGHSDGPVQARYGNGPLQQSYTSGPAQQGYSTRPIQHVSNQAAQSGYNNELFLPHQNTQPLPHGYGNGPVQHSYSDRTSRHNSTSPPIQQTYSNGLSGSGIYRAAGPPSNGIHGANFVGGEYAYRSDTMSSGGASNDSSKSGFRKSLRNMFS